MNESTFKRLRLFILYLLTYWLLGFTLWLLVMGYANTLRDLVASPKSDLSGILVFLSSFIATALLFFFKRKSFSDQPYPYFIFGFYVGNLSLLVLFILDILFRELIEWKLPDSLLIFIVPFVELLFSYLMFGFAFLAVIPALASAFVLYWVQKKILLK